MSSAKKHRISIGPFLDALQSVEQNLGTMTRVCESETIDHEQKLLLATLSQKSLQKISDVCENVESLERDYSQPVSSRTRSGAKRKMPPKSRLSKRRVIMESSSSSSSSDSFEAEDPETRRAAFALGDTVQITESAEQPYCVERVFFSVNNQVFYALRGARDNDFKCVEEHSLERADPIAFRSATPPPAPPAPPLTDPPLSVIADTITLTDPAAASPPTPPPRDTEHQHNATKKIHIVPEDSLYALRDYMTMDRDCQAFKAFLGKQLNLAQFADKNRAIEFFNRRSETLRGMPAVATRVTLEPEQICYTCERVRACMPLEQNESDKLCLECYCVGVQLDQLLERLSEIKNSCDAEPSPKQVKAQMFQILCALEQIQNTTRYFLLDQAS